MSSLPRRRSVRALLTALLALTGLTVPQAPAQAAVTILCEGYRACQQAGMGHDGYATASGTMYWRMYSGHNCTNYAAYRMVRSGMPNVRPWDGGGNATYWGSYMSKITDQTPAVGSVAWWKAGVYPAGSAGHVAYVERVVSADEIIVSQDSWGGDFSWARITRGTKGWPSGFIHFNDVPLVNVERPSLGGTAKVGAVLTATPGAWDPSEVETDYRWIVDGERLRGATEPTLEIDEALLGSRVKVRVIASQLGYTTARATSTATPAVLPGTISSTVAPQVTGEAVVDRALSVTAGQWTPAPDIVRYRWSADGQPIDGATSAQLALTPDLVGTAVSVKVTADREGYDPVSVTSAPRTIAPGTLTVVREAALEGTARPGEQLTLQLPQSIEESAVKIRWLREGEPVPDASGATYDLTPADLGTRVSAEVTLERPGYTPVVRSVTSDRVRTPATVTATTERAGRNGRRLRIEVDVTAQHLSPVAGRIKVKALGETTVRTLSDGTADLVLRGVPRTGFRVRVVHPGTLATTRDVERVRIRRVR